jgi:2-keto-4-pentenoate hydratase/2-oxohepta-3-ene-1,7-dioic acid hydratase in catechol pathway
LRLATIVTQGQRRVGRQSACGQFIELFDTDGTRGALPLLELAAAGKALPTTTNRVPVTGAHFIAPLPAPRRNLFCVGRNYHAHAKELRETSSRTARSRHPGLAHRVQQGARMRDRPRREVRLPGRGVVADRLRSRAGRRHRPRRPQHPRADAMEHVFGYTIVNDVTARDVQMRHQPVGPGQELRHLLPDGAVAGHGRRDGRHDTRVRCWVNGELRQDATPPT